MLTIVFIVALVMGLLAMVGMVVFFYRKQPKSEMLKVSISDTMKEWPLKFSIRHETGTVSEQSNPSTSTSGLRIVANCLQRDFCTSQRVSELGAGLPRASPWGARISDGMKGSFVRGREIGPPSSEDSEAAEDYLEQGIQIGSSYSMREQTPGRCFSSTSSIGSSPGIANVDSSFTAPSSPLTDKCPLMENPLRRTDMDFARASPQSSCGIKPSAPCIKSIANPSKPPVPPAPPPLPPLPGRPIKKMALPKPSMANLASPRKGLLETLPSPGSGPLNPGAQGVENSLDASRQLKPLYWDTFKADSDASMVWNRLSGSFEPDETTMKALFGFNQSPPMKKSSSEQPQANTPGGRDQPLPYRKAQNIAIQLRALNVTRDEIRCSLLEGGGLSTEVLEALVKMEPTKEEEQLLRQYIGNPSKLGTAEHFLRSILEIPCAFRRLNAMLYMATFREELEQVHGSLDALEIACRELMSNHTFAKILEVVLKTGNRLNKGTLRGGAQAFKMDVLLKLADVKGADGKTTLLHFVVEEILTAEGAHRTSTKDDDPTERISSNNHRQVGSQVISGLVSGLPNVKRAAGMDLAALRETVSNLADGLQGLKDGLRCQYKECCTIWAGSASELALLDVFSDFIASFVEEAEVELDALKGQMREVIGIIQKTNNYFCGDSAKEEANPLSLFIIVKTFLTMLNQACNDVMKTRMKLA